MANEEGSTCDHEVPLKRPRLNEDDASSPAFADFINRNPEINRDESIQRNEDDIAGPSDKTGVKISESLMSNDGSSSADAKREAALDNSDSDNLSEISDLSGLSEDAWKPIAGPISWVQQQMTEGHNPREILQDLVTADTVIPPDLDDFTMWKIIINLLSEPPKRKKLQHINTLDDVLDLLKTCKKIVVLTGAGVSVSCGIPDFRSRNGIYARLAVDFPDLPDPQAMFDIRYFRNDPRPFFKFAKEIYPGQFEPSRCHKFIQLIEAHGKLLRNYTQNIDTLEQVAGINNVIQCHGSFAGATCMVCRHKVTADQVKSDIFNQVIPLCSVCPSDSPLSILKPDIVFFGESLPDEFHRQMADDKDECDLLIVIGSSLKVRPVALIPNSLPADVPQILINREPLPHMSFDVELLGDCDCIISELCKRLGVGWSQLADASPPLTEIHRTELATPLTLSAAVSQTDNQNCVSESRELSNTVLDSSKPSCDAAQQVGEKHDTTHSNSPVQGEQKAAFTSDPSQSGQNVDSHKGEADLALSASEISAPRHDGSDQLSNVKNGVEECDSPGKKECSGEDGPRDGDLDTSLQEMRRLWHSQDRQSVAKRLKDHEFLFLPPCRYVFHGAEVTSIVAECEEEDCDSDQDSSVSESRHLASSQCGNDECHQESSVSESRHLASSECGDEECHQESSVSESRHLRSNQCGDEECHQESSVSESRHLRSNQCGDEEGVSPSVVGDGETNLKLCGGRMEVVQDNLTLT